MDRPKIQIKEILILLLLVGISYGQGDTELGGNVSLVDDEANLIWTEGSNTISLRANSTLATDLFWLFPTGWGADGNPLITNGSSTLSWGTPLYIDITNLRLGIGGQATATLHVIKEITTPLDSIHELLSLTTIVANDVNPGIGFGTGMGFYAEVIGTGDPNINIGNLNFALAGPESDENDGTFQLQIYEADAGEVITLLRTESRRIGFRSDTSDYFMDFYIQGIDTGDATLIIDMEEQDRLLTWSGGESEFTIETDSAINQDLTTDSIVVVFEKLTIGQATNSIVLASNTITMGSVTIGTNTITIGSTTIGTNTITVYGDIDILHTATEADDHALELDVDAAGYGDVKAININYITGAISTGEDEGVILINIDEIAATGGDVFGLEVLATEGSAGIYGMKVGAVIGPVHQDSGVFVNPTTGTDNTTSTDVSDMIDAATSTTTAIFENNNEYILIGATPTFEEIEFIITTGASGGGIKPTFWYSTAGSHTFTQFTPVDGTNGFRNTGVAAWDASDLSSHGINTNTDTYDIKIIRTRNSLTTSPVLGYAKVVATTEYIWDKNGDVSIRGLTAGTATITNSAVLGSDSAVFQPNADSTTFFQVLDADGGTPVLNVNSTDERVGIGTAAPDALLHVLNVGGAFTPAILAEGMFGSRALFRTSNQDTTLVDGDPVGILDFEFNDGSGGAGVQVRIEARSEGDNSGALVFITGENTSLGDRMYIDKAGNVGINEISPQDTLEVNGTVLIKDKFKFTQDDGNEYIDSLDPNGMMDYGATLEHRFWLGGIEQINLTDGVLAPTTDNDIDLGTITVEFKDLFLDGTAHIDTLDVDINATIGGTLNVTGKASAGEQGLPSSAVGTSAGNIYWDDDTRLLYVYSDNSAFGWGHFIQPSGGVDEITAAHTGTVADITTLNTEVTTNGDSDLDNVTLANGISGQVKHIYCVVEGNAADTWKITPATMVGGTQITFSGAGNGCTLVYADNEGWIVIGNNGGTVS